MSGSFEIVLVRHGQSTANAEGVWQGQLEFPLSGLGRAQASRAGKALASSGAVSGLYTSPLARAFETAELIRDELRSAGKFSGDLVAVPDLTERHGGLLQGRPFEQTRAENPELISKFRSLPEEEAWSLVGAETDAELMTRFGRAVSDIRSRHAGGPARAVIVAHGGVLRAFLRATFGGEVLPDTARAPNASLTRVAWEPHAEAPELLELASVSHLEGLEKA